MRRGRAVGVLIVALVLLGACTGPSATRGARSRASAPTSSPSLYTLSPLPVPTRGPPTGRLRADIRQSSRDTLLDRFEVWIDNDTAASIRPTRISYRSGRFRAALPGTRLRDIPSRSERGFPIHQPARPACDAHTGTDTGTSGAASVRVTYRTRGRPGTRTVSIAADDETSVVGRYAASRCLGLAVRRVARLSFADAVPQDPPGGRGADGHLTLVARTSGRAGHTLQIDTVTGTPVLSPTRGDAWRPGVRITGDQPNQRIVLPVRPTRCDAHAFAESGGATTFLIGIRLDGVPGQLRILMSPLGSKHAIDFARTDCGLLSTVS